MSLDARLGHVSMPVENLQAATDFYRELLGLTVSMEGSIPALGDFVFLANRPDAELPVIALHTRREARHAALEVGSLDALTAFREHVRASRIPVSMALNHGCSLSIYFHDPEGNMVEVFWGTGRRTDDPVAEPLDIDNLEAAGVELLEAGAVGG